MQRLFCRRWQPARPTQNARPAATRLSCLPQPNIYTDIGEFGFIQLRGRVDVNSSSGATVNNTQNVSISGVNMKTPPQSYVSGHVTTSIDTSNTWNNASGGGSGWGASQSYNASAYQYNKTNTQTKTASSSAGFVAGGGFATGIAAGYQGYNYANTHASANGSSLPA